MNIPSFPPLSHEAAARSAERRNRRLRRKYPLFAFAGILETITPEQVQAEMIRIKQRWQNAYLAMLARAAELQTLAQEHLSPDDFAAYQAKLQTLPSGIEYQADLWWQALRLLQPTIAQKACRYCHDPHKEAILQRLQSACFICGRQVC